MILSSQVQLHLTPLPTFANLLADLRLHLFHLQQGLLPVALGTAALGAEDEQGCGTAEGRLRFPGSMKRYQWEPAEGRLWAWKDRFYPLASVSLGRSKQVSPSVPLPFVPPRQLRAWTTLDDFS